MKMIRKIGSLVLAIMMIAVVGLASAADLNTNGVVGDTVFTQDTPTSQGKSINIKKELTVFNPDEAFVYGPAFTYTYTVTPGSGNKDITDAASQHASGLSTSTKTIAGITTNVKVCNGSAGSDTSASGTLAWTNADILDASSSGTANYKNIVIDFSDVVFTGAGVYRYLITETPEKTNASYAVAGITETTGSRVRYLDVYVMRDATNYSTGATASDWIIYGYVCFYNDTAITPDNATTVPVKTTGFVTGTTNGSTSFTADQYHTYNLTIGKTLTGDNSMANHQFPFDATWANPSGSASGTFQFIGKTTGNATLTTGTTSVDATMSIGGTSVAAHTKVGVEDAVTTASKDGTPTIANGATVKYIGIPQAAYVTITETNDVTGTTYTTKATETIGSGTANDVVFTDASTAALSTDKKTATTDQGETAVYAESSTVTADSNYAIQFTNVLAVISPTGYVTRFAPYALILIGGIALLVIAMKRRNHKEDD